MRYEVVIEDAINAYVLDNEENTIVALCSTKRPDLGFDKLLDLVEQANKSKVYQKFWIELCDGIIAENDKDGWCRLVVTKEEAIQMKKTFETM